MTRRIRNAISNLIAELRRRRVIKTTVAYIVAAWVLIETSSTIFPAIFLPEWSVRLVIAAAFLGLPLVVVLAWVFDIRRAPGIEHPGSAGTEGASEGEADSSVRTPPSPDSAVASIAVLPFENLSPDERNHYLAYGLATELHSTLARVHRLRVIARSISFLTADSDTDVRKIARNLNAKFVISGSVRCSGERIRVTVELDNALEGIQIWSETYDREITNVFEMQKDIAVAVASAFGGARLGEEIKTVAARPTASLDAWSLVQRARSYLLAFTPQALADAVPLLHRSISLDPEYAIAHAALGSILAERVLNALSEDSDEEQRLAIQSAERAFALSPADPLVLKLCGATWAYFGDTDRSIVGLRHAVEIAPFDFGAWGYLGWPLVESGAAADLEEVHSIMSRLLQAAPRHPGSSYWLYHRSVAYTCAGQLEPALEFARKAVGQNPTRPWGLMHLANALGALDMHSEAQLAIGRVLGISPSFSVEHYAKTIRGMSSCAAAVEPRLAGIKRLGYLEQ